MELNLNLCIGVHVRLWLCRYGLTIDELLAMEEEDSGISISAMEYYKKESRKERRFKDESSIREKVGLASSYLSRI